ncbi:hypothetical protein IPM19_01770 [bacterium]|nr:MAG: hypothetical protein IPM19_01770 [bacterium]
MKNLQDSLNNYRVLAIFINLAILVTVIFATVYFSVQQSYRTNANDPQVEVVGQVEEVIKQDVPLDAIVSEAEQIDIAESLSLFVMIFDSNRQLIGSSATLDGQAPTPPENVFALAKEQGENRFTWEPKPGVQVAAVLKPVDDKAFVLAGRSLKEINDREAALLKTCIIGWAISVLLLAGLSLLLKPRQSVAVIEETNVTVVEPSGDATTQTITEETVIEDVKS